MSSIFIKTEQIPRVLPPTERLPSNIPFVVHILDPVYYIHSNKLDQVYAVREVNRIGHTPLYRIKVRSNTPHSTSIWVNHNTLIPVNPSRYFVLL